MPSLLLLFPFSSLCPSPFPRYFYLFEKSFLLVTPMIVDGLTIVTGIPRLSAFPSNISLQNLLFLEKSEFFTDPWNSKSYP
jgi:hypothetical protein